MTMRSFEKSGHYVSTNGRTHKIDFSIKNKIGLWFFSIHGVAIMEDEKSTIITKKNPLNGN
jgi:hypothetical protein